MSPKITQWCWRWHVIAGLLSLPFVILLTVTGIVYMFKAEVNHYFYHHMTEVTPQLSQPLSYEQQLASVQRFSNLPVVSLTLASNANQASVFRLKGKGRTKHLVYIDPYTGTTMGEFKQADSLMYNIRKLHGELLLDKPGTLVVELIASWFIVLLTTGLIIWWPSTKQLAGVFSIRFNASRRILWRDLHAVTSFWIGLILLIVIAGAMPWTDVFGTNLKRVQKITDSGYPMAWRSDKGVSSQIVGSPLTLDEMVLKAQSQSLQGVIEIKLPQKDEGPFKVSNRSFWLSDQQVMYFDQYSGDPLKQLTWDDVGILMDMRQVFMRLHQGEYGRANWWILLIGCMLFLVANIASIIAYVKRKPRQRFGIPAVPKSFKMGYGLLLLIMLLAVVFPLFGLSVILIVGGQYVFKKQLSA